jgi:hypothetical protein
LKTKKWLCWGHDNPYLLIERARTLNEAGESVEKFKQRACSSLGEVVKPLSFVTDWIKIYKSNFKFN